MSVQRKARMRLTAVWPLGRFEAQVRPGGVAVRTLLLFESHSPPNIVQAPVRSGRNVSLPGGHHLAQFPVAPASSQHRHRVGLV